MTVFLVIVVVKKLLMLFMGTQKSTLYLFKVKKKKKKLKQSENGFDHKTTRFLSEMLKMNENLEHINISSKLFW